MSSDKGVNVADLSLMELNQYSQILEEELKTLTQHYSALRQGRERFVDSKVTLDNLEACKEGDKMLVPLTKSLFVPGELSSTSNAIIEVGAGYYIKMSTAKGKDFMDRKTKSITDTMTEIEKAVSVKRQQAEIMQVHIRQKSQQAQAQGQAAQK